MNKFKIIRERRIGPLPDKPLAVWLKLMVRRDKLVAAQERFEAAINKFTEKLNTIAPPPQGGSPHRGYKLDDKGTLFQVLCDCPPCQAKLHGMTVTQTVDAMIAADLIRQDRIPHAREEAAMLDAKELRRCSMRAMMN